MDQTWCSQQRILVHDPWAKCLGQIYSYPAYDQCALHVRYIHTTGSWSPGGHRWCHDGPHTWSMCCLSFLSSECLIGHEGPCCSLPQQCFYSMTLRVWIAWPGDQCGKLEVLERDLLVVIPNTAGVWARRESIDLGYFMLKRVLKLISWP